MSWRTRERNRGLWWGSELRSASIKETKADFTWEKILSDQPCGRSPKFRSWLNTWRTTPPGAMLAPTEQRLKMDFQFKKDIDGRQTVSWYPNSSKPSWPMSRRHTPNPSKEQTPRLRENIALVFRVQSWRVFKWKLEADVPKGFMCRTFPAGVALGNAEEAPRDGTVLEQSPHGNNANLGMKFFLCDLEMTSPYGATSSTKSRGDLVGHSRNLLTSKTLTTSTYRSASWCHGNWWKYKLLIHHWHVVGQVTCPSPIEVQWFGPWPGRLWWKVKTSSQ